MANCEKPETIQPVTYKEQANVALRMALAAKDQAMNKPAVRFIHGLGRERYLHSLLTQR